MIKSSYLFLSLVVLGMACKEAEKQTPNGFKYAVIRAGSGTPAKPNDILVFDFQLKDSKDSVWNDSYKDGMPAAMQIRDTAEIKNEDGITQMLRELTAGDSVRASMTVSEFFKNLIRRPVPPGVDSTLSVTYTIKAGEIMTLEAFMKWREEKVKSNDEKAITKFLTENKIDAVRDTSGIYYKLHSTNGGAKPTAENCVEVKYEGRFLKDGRPFDQNNKVAFSLNRVIQGWKLAIPMLAKGDSGTFYIPSKLAYGPEGPRFGMPPDAVLIFDVTLLDFKNTFDEATNSCK